MHVPIVRALTYDGPGWEAAARARFGAGEFPTNSLCGPRGALGRGVARLIELVCGEQVFYYGAMSASRDHHETGDACLWTRADLSGHVEAMLEATSVLEMGEAARRLRSDAARIVRLLNRAQPLAGPLVAVSGPDPVQQQEELTVLAVGLTTAVDYLLNLLDSSAGASSPFALADDTSWSLEGGRADAARDRLVRLRLDARGAVVRQGMRLLGGIACGSRQRGGIQVPCVMCEMAG